MSLRFSWGTGGNFLPRLKNYTYFGMHSSFVAEELYSLCEKSSLCRAILKVFTREGYKSPRNPPNSELTTCFVFFAVDFFLSK